MWRWYVLYTKHKEEIRSKENLDIQKIKSYLPMIVGEKNDGKIYKKAMFSRYIFVLLNDESSNFTKIRSTRGVISFLTFGKHIATVPDAVIASIEEQERAMSPMFHNSSRQLPKSLNKKNCDRIHSIANARTNGERTQALLDIIQYGQYAVNCG